MSYRAAAIRIFWSLPGFGALFYWLRADDNANNVEIAAEIQKVE
jgi:hypothetical protein